MQSIHLQIQRRNWTEHKLRMGLFERRETKENSDENSSETSGNTFKIDLLEVPIWNWKTIASNWKDSHNWN